MMNKYLSSSLNNVVSWDLETSWAARSLQEQVQFMKYNESLKAVNSYARFQQRQMQEKEEKLLKLYETQQQRAFDRVSRGSAGSNTSVGSTGGGKVRQMFDERRQKAGVDRSYPLEPLKSKTNSRGGSMDRKANVTTTSRTTVRSTVQKSVSSVRNGKPIVSKREVLHSIYNNNDGDESYEEHRFEDMNNDLLNANTDRGIIAMMDSHNINDNLDDEVMPQIGFDEVDNVLLSPRQKDVVPKPVQNGVTKKIETRSSLKANGISPAKKESNPSPRKPVKAPTPAKSLSVSPAPAPVKSPRNTTPTSPSKTPTSTMSAKQKSPNRAPTSSRPSAKQSAKTGVARDDLMECNFCGRRFAADRLQKHEDICSKTGKKKRKVYDATKHRVVGTELESYVLRGQKGKSAASVKHWKHGDSTARQEIISKSKQGSKKDWRKTHEEFIAAIRAAKETQAHLAKGGKLSDLPPPPPSSNPDYVQCPHCGRRFNEAAAERHIPKCANFQFNKPKPKAAGKR